MNAPITWLCSDPLCNNEARYTMIVRGTGRKALICIKHREELLTKVRELGFTRDEIANLESKELV